MPKFLPLDFPPGLYNHGVDLDSRARWRDGNLVRWRFGSLRPVGGWVALQRTDSGGMSVGVTVPSGVARAMHTWLDNAGERQIAVGVNDYLYATGDRMVLKDITPAGFTPGVTDENLAYGGKGYGMSTYGTARISDGTPAPAALWSMDNFGQYLYACTSYDKNIYVWQLDDGLTDVDAATPAVTLASLGGDTPPTCESLIVTAERFLFALAAGNNPRKVQWCDREDTSVWIPATTNEAGDYELQTNGRIIGAVKVRGRTLIITSTDAHVATYLGPPNVYGFQRIGTSCGAASSRVIAGAQMGAFWMGDSSFYVYDGSTVTELPCDVYDKIFSDINLLYFDIAYAVTNRRVNEVWWYYPSSASTEIDRYVAYNYLDGYWTAGEIDRTAGNDLGVYDDPIWIASTGELYRHEVGVNHGGEQPWVESGPIVLGDGDQIMHVTRMLQDEKVAQEVSASFDTNFWPDGTTYSHGPYEMGNSTDVRFSGRQVRMRITGDDNVDWRVSGIRLEYTLGGRR